MPSPTSRAAVAVAALAATGLLTGCGALTERAVESALGQIDGVEGVDIDRSGESFSISTDEGTLRMDASEGQMTLDTPEGSMSAGATTEVPPEIRDHFRLPDDFEIHSSFQTTEHGVTTTMVGGAITGRSVDAVLADVEQAVDEAGLTVASRTTSDGLAQLTTDEDGTDGLRLAALLIGDGDTVQLTVTLATDDPEDRP